MAEVLQLKENKLHNASTDLGHLYELIVRLGVERTYKDECVENIYGLDVDPALVLHRRGHHQLTEKVTKQWLWSVMDEDLVNREADKLCAKLVLSWKNGKSSFQIGSPLFTKSYDAAMRRVLKGRRCAPWPLEVDVAAEHPDVGLLEVKASGHIGGQKVMAVIKRHLVRGLALGRDDLPLRFGTFYRNKDDQTALRYYVRESSGNLLMPESLIGLAFPSVSENRFERRFHALGVAIGLEMVFSDFQSIPGGADGLAEYERRQAKRRHTLSAV